MLEVVTEETGGGHDTEGGEDTVATSCMKLRSPDSDKMEVLYPGNLALLSMFLKNPDSDKGDIKKDEGRRGKLLHLYLAVA